ncbi:hypothetical protein [Micromonospora cathayae]|uniref:DUF5129 domain-containing protein n=1 Tax=Micromonospora cathayae TaxID=3028804 RepID=A0ABY7ZL80_9ACTN|nr:hypothetical protein [Micromonospora sp. HUAS 3]WDZ83536.1 hypothetical protein PVK37_24170 [Micromonospora sp. HUAS 3]
MRRLGRFLGTPFGLAVAGCLVLAGWALWSGGILDGPVAREVRTSSVYAAPGTGLDEAAAERVIGNRRLVVIMLDADADLRDGCHDVKRAADGTVVLLLRPDGDDYDTYGCALLPDRDDENFGKAFVAESVIGRGIDQYVDRPLEAVKVITVNYDLLVRAGTVPDGTRTISPSLPRFLVAAAAVLAVLVGSAGVYAAGLRAGRLTARRRRLRDAHADERSALSAATAVLAQQIIDLDRRYARVPRRVGGPIGGTVAPRDDGQRAFVRDYRRLVADHTDLLDAVTGASGDPAELARLTARVEALSRRAGLLAGDDGSDGPSAAPPSAAPSTAEGGGRSGRGKPVGGVDRHRPQ